MFLLDSNAVIAIMAERPACARAHFQRALASRHAVAIPSVVELELWYGAIGSRRRTESEVRLRGFLATIVSVLAFDAEDAMTAAEIRAFLARQGTPIGPYDLLIAAQALRRDATLVTANLDEFARVPGLKCVNWEEGA